MSLTVKVNFLNLFHVLRHLKARSEYFPNHLLPFPLSLKYYLLLFQPGLLVEVLIFYFLVFFVKHPCCQWMLGKITLLMAVKWLSVYVLSRNLCQLGLLPLLRLNGLLPFSLFQSNLRGFGLQTTFGNAF